MRPMRPIRPLIVWPLLALAAGVQAPSTAAAALKIQDLPPGEVERLLERRLSQRFVPGEVIVRLRPVGRAASSPAAAMGALGLEVKEVQTSGGEVIFRLPDLPVARLAAPGAAAGSGADAAADTIQAAAERTLALVETLRARPDVEYAQPNYIFEIAARPNDAGFPAQWHYLDNGRGAGQSAGGIGLPQAWEGNTGSPSVVVAVVDTGILPHHEEIQGSPNLTAGYDMISDARMANDGNGRDADASDPGDAVAAGECDGGNPAQSSSWHGTHVAGTIGVGRTNNGIGVAGINWRSRVQPVRVLGKCGGTMVDINDGIRWAAGLPVPGVPTNPTPARVINLSLGGLGDCSYSPALQSAINDAIARGVTVVVAAGNEAADASRFSPASCTGVITVAASDARGYLAARYSNYGVRVDLMAPGGDVQRDDNQDGEEDGVLSLVNGGYAYYNGTSMAAPHVAGVAALLLAEDGRRTPAQIRDLLVSRALPRSSTQCPRPCGAGLLSAVALSSLPTPTPTPTPTPGPIPDPTPTPTPIPTPISPTGPVTLTPSPTRLTLDAGESAQSAVSVRRSGLVDAGKAVGFVSANPSVFRVSPANAVTDARGGASATVTGVSAGEADLVVESQGARVTSVVHVSPKSVPALPGPLFAALLAGFWLLLRRRG